MGKYEYPNDFIEFWQSFQPPKAASKLDALKAWKQTQKIRPDMPVMVACCQAYNIWLAEQSKLKGREYPKLHAATFLRQARWEGFETDARAILEAKDGQSRKEYHQAMDTRLDALEAEIGRAAFEHWFMGTTVSQTNGVPHIDCISPFYKAEIEKRFGAVLRKIFGQELILSVRGK